MSNINAIFPNLNLINILKRCDRRHGPRCNNSFKDGKPLYFAEASRQHAL